MRDPSPKLAPLPQAVVAASVGEAVVQAAVSRKLARLARGAQPRVLDLFSGCGGISLGFHRAGCAIVGNVELNPDAARSHALNFHSHDAAALERHSRARDISATTPSTLASELGLGDVPDAVDIIVGGPPCQAYARVGRAKLRHVAEHPEAFKQDQRRNLYLRYLQFVREFRPIALLMENVPDILNQDGHNVVEDMIGVLDELGYQARYTLLNAAYFGVPQARDRLYMLAYRRELGIRITFPAPTHHVELPAGYLGTRTHALKAVVASNAHSYVVPEKPHAGLLPAVTAFDAIGDLPGIMGCHLKPPRRTALDEAVPHQTGRASSYARAMRTWPGFESQGVLSDHIVRHLPRDGRIFAEMPEGAEYPLAHALAVRLFRAAAREAGLHHRSNAYADLRRRMVPPYDPGKFPNKWWKLRSDSPVRTLMAHLGRDCYSHIHFDSAQARTISIREAARLQSFPDGWRFAGMMNSAFGQIGNAVPPIMSAAIATTMLETLRGSLLRRGGIRVRAA